MMQTHPTALIADDEPLLREVLESHLARIWPELEIVAQARNGREAVELFEALKPDVCFLDIHMPSLTGVEVAGIIGDRAHLVFVTAFDQYAVQAFKQGVLDYIVKPVEAERLAETVTRLKGRLQAAEPATNTDQLLKQLAAQLQRNTAPPLLRWVHAQVGQSLRLIPVEDIDFLKSDAKFTLVAWRGDGGQAAEALVRTPLKELQQQLDPNQFAQVHRSVVVNLRSVSHVTRGENETATIYLKNRRNQLPVSRSYLHLFRQM
ncbi:LytTR family DNA-binding domain-containing protein [Chromobacterium amazonense]|uniref:LytR/AlgR family response regulator transcription factor n=1 Tax=Chromobacterium amazonense TaxID=1382803 RepID=UPI00237E36BD|nr:LytTR family DNA-binding domain-containing protein [Chromobacterium amazonense]MDE1715567.1 LytTR family DNA-binding domain-containing protein [Chromobacterium amazonense]